MSAPHEWPVRAPEGARAASPRALDLARLPGAQLAARGAWTRGPERHDLACVRGDGRWWLEGLSRPLLAAANATLRETAGGRALEVGPLSWRGPMGLQRATARAGRDHLVAEHRIGFAGPSGDVVLCTSVCQAPSACEPVAGAQVPWSAAPPPGPLARAVRGAAAQPALSAAAGGGALLAMVALILWRRPRPRP